MDEKVRYDKGLQTRREVLGKEHVDRTQANLNEFNAPFQEFITRYAWGEVWERAGLTRRERSLITLAMLVALNRDPEFRMHIRAALNNGVTLEEIREVLIQAGLYCGLPAANAAFHAAEQVINGTEQNLTQSRLRSISPFSSASQGRKVAKKRQKDLPKSK